MSTTAASSQTLRGRSWKPENDLSAASRQNRAKRVKRIIWTVLGLFLLLVLWILLAGPFYLPRPQVFVVMQGDYDLLSVPRVGFTGNDEAALDALDPALYANRRHRGVHHLPASQTADRLVQLHNQLEPNVTGRSDVVMFYIRAQGVADDGVAYLLGSDFDLNNPGAGRAPLRQVLDQISRCSAAVKIVLLDQGGLDYNPRMGLLVNEFSELLKRDVAATRDGNLWVMAAHSSLERSHLVFPWRRSVFGYFLTEGLQGAADSNRDSGVDLVELFQFVTSQQANFVNTLTGGSETQTPMLLWGGGPSSSAAPYLNLVTIPKGFGVSAVQLLDAKAALQGKGAGTGTGAPAATGSAAPAGTKSALLPQPKTAVQEPLPAFFRSDESASAIAGAAAPPSAGVDAAAREARQRASAQKAADWLAEAWWSSRPSAWVAYQGPALGAAGGTSAGGTSTAGTAASGTSAGTASTAATSGAASTGAAAAAGTGAKSAATGTAAATSTSSAATTSAAAAASTGGAPAGAAADPNAPQKTPRQLVHEMIDEAWRVVDALETRSEENPYSPVDYAPHLWREYVESLTAYESRFLSGYDYLGKDDEGKSGLVSYQTVLRDLATHLRGRLLPLRSLVQNEPLPLGTLEASIAFSLYQARPKAIPEVDRPRTMAAVKWFPWPAGSTVAREAAAVRAQWLQFLDRKEGKGFPEWAAEQVRLHPDWIELQFAHALAQQLDRVDWPTAVLALRAIESRERIAASAPWIRPWLDSRWEEAETRSWTAQKELLNAFERDLERPRNLLRGALSTFRALDDETQMLLAVHRLRNDLTFRLPYYVHWNALGRGYRVAYAPLNGDVEELNALLKEVGSRLSAPGKEQIPLLRKLLDRMVDVRGRLEASLQETSVSQLVDDDPDPSRAWAARQLLFWPLPPAAVRKRLLDYVSRYQPPTSVRPVQRRDVARNGRETIDVDWAGLQIRTGLLVQSLRLAGGSATSKEYNLADVENAWEELQKVAEEQSKSDTPASAPYWPAYRKLGKAVRQYYEAFLLDTAAAARRGRDLSAPETRTGRIAVLDRAGKALRLVHCHDARLLESINPLEQLRAAQLYDMLVWHQQRFWLVRQSGVAQAEADVLGAAARSYFLQASRIPDQPPPKPLEEKRLPLEFEGPRELTVPAERPADVEVIVRSRGEASSEAWVILAYDPELLDVGGASGGQLYHRHRLASDPDLLSEPPSFNLSPGTPQRIRLQVNAKRSYEEPTKLVVMIKSEGLFSEYTAVVHLPTPETVEVALTGARDSWEATGEGYLLFPFPNAATDFPIALKNRTERPLRAKVELFALPEGPIGSLAGQTWPLDEQGRLLPDHPPLRLLGRVAETMLPVGGVPVPLAFPKDAPPPPPPPAKDAPAGAAPAPAAKPAPPEVSQGMALVVTDLERDRATVKRIRFAVQRPRRYLVPKAEYLPDQGRLQIVVKARSPSAMPPGGSKVVWNVGNELSEDVKVLREGKVEAPNWETTLYAEIGPNPRRVVNVVLDVDGFPRAFQIPVRLAESVGDSPPDDDVAQIVIAAPTPGSLFKSPLGKVPVQFRADAPVDAFQNKDDLLEIGFDLNNDRELYNERTWKFLSDRYATVALVEMLEGGGFRTLANASDFKFELDAPQLRNGAVSVLGKLSLRGKTVYSDSVPIRIDGAPPVVTPIGGLSAVEGQKEMLVYLEVADDVSGVAKVEVCVDPKRQARWAATKPVEAEYNLQGKWIAKLPLDPYPPGVYQILVRAKDKVDNESELTPIDLIVAPKPKPRMHRIAGTVSFDGEGREDMKVTIEGGPERGPVTTEAGGTFRFEEMPAGKYKVKAEGVIKNKTRRAEQEVVVAPEANQVPPVRLLLK